jgi:hypothetical protein
MFTSLAVERLGRGKKLARLLVRHDGGNGMRLNRLGGTGRRHVVLQVRDPLFEVSDTLTKRGADLRYSLGANDNQGQGEDNEELR